MSGIIKEERIGGQRLILGNCLEVMPLLGRFDAVVTDPPYGSTACKWDAVIPFQSMWAQLGMVTKDNSPVVLTASQPFTSALIMSNASKFRHAWVWNKVFAANVMQAKRQPLKTVEDVLVFSMGKSSPEYFPQMVKRETPIKAGGTKAGQAIPNESGEAARSAWKDKVYDEKYPTSILTFNVRDGRGFHPTQKPIGLMEYVLLTYTQAQETVLDFTMGSGTTLAACQRIGRRGTGIELDPVHFQTACERVHNACRRVDEATRQPDMFVQAPQPAAKQTSLL